MLIVVAAEAAVEGARDGHIGSHLITYGGGAARSPGSIAHLVIRRVAPYADPVLLPIAVLLNGLGLVMIHRLDLGLQQQARTTAGSFAGAAAPTQVVWTGARRRAVHR